MNRAGPSLVALVIERHGDVLPVACGCYIVFGLLWG